MFERTAELSVGVAGLLEVLKPWAEQFGLKEKSWYPIIVWLVAFVAATVGAVVFNINVLHEVATAPDWVGWVFTGFVGSFGSEIAHRFLEIFRGLAGKAEPEKAEA